MAQIRFLAKLFSRVTPGQHDERRRSAAPRRVDEECHGEEPFALVRRFRFLESEQCKRFLVCM